MRSLQVFTLLTCSNLLVAAFIVTSWGTNSRFRLPTLELGQRAKTCAANTGGKSIQGVQIDGGCRYTIKYGEAKRWEASKASLTLGNYVERLPPACPQLKGEPGDGATQSEDCLYATVYTPLNVAPNAKLPVFVWVHGGSFISGSASAPGLVGSKLATEGNIIVIVPQYRLGVFGFLPPSSSPAASEPNLGMGDLVLALKSVQTYARDFGGDGGKVVVGAQSSGAHMIRTLWAMPSARGLFRGAILQSDPLFYGLSSPNITQALTKAFYTSGKAGACKTLDCLRNVSSDDLVAAQEELIQTAPFAIPGIPYGEPIRPTFGSPSVPADPTALLFSQPGRLSSPPNQLPVLVTTTANEGGQITSGLFPSPIPLAAANETMLATLSFLVGPERAHTLIQSGLYKFGKGEDAFRETFERLVSDGIWRCPARSVGREWAKNGGKVWVGEWTRGKAYVSNKDSGYCSTNGRVCHEDDILPTFGGSNDDLGQEVTTAWLSFIKTLDPNPSVPGNKGLKNRWAPFTPTSGDGDVRAIGGGKVKECPKDFWGKKVQFDWEVYT